MAIKFTCDKKNLLAIILPASSAASNKSTLPVIEGLLFSLKDNILSVCGYDLEKGIKTSGAVYAREEGAVILNAQKITSIIKNFPDCDITFEADDRDMVNIKGANSDFTIHGLTADAFPNLPELTGENAFSISRSLLKEMINSTVFAVSQSDSRPVLTGELFRVDGKSLTVVALDNYRLALREEKNCVFDNDGKFSFVVPGKALSELSRLLDDSEEMVRVEFTTKYIIFKADDVLFFSRLLEGEYLDYTRAIPAQSAIKVRLDRSLFAESAARASLLVDERLKTPLRCSFEGNILRVSCSTQYGNVDDNLPIVKEGENIEIGFNNRYLLDALRACGDENITVSLTTPLSSMTITPSEKNPDSNSLYLVLPCKLKN